MTLKNQPMYEHDKKKSSRDKLATTKIFFNKIDKYKIKYSTTRIKYSPTRIISFNNNDNNNNNINNNLFENTNLIDLSSFIDILIKKSDENK